MLRMEKAQSFDEFIAEEEEERSECTSGCQSGWTLYLGQPQSQGRFTSSLQQRTEDEEEDLSMLSDASSGPPHAPEEDDNKCCCSDDGDGFSFLPLDAAAECGSKRRRVAEAREDEEEVEKNSSLLDDTASSPLFSFPMSTKKLLMEDDLEHSSGFSATHSKVYRQEGEKKMI